LVSSLAGVLLCEPHRREIEAEVAELQSRGEQADVTAIARRMYNRLHDTTRSVRVNRRNEELDRLAQGLGFDGLSQFLTSWKNGEITITVERHQPG
jgi:hypothetical protein